LRIAIFSDIHGNAIAFEACIEQISQFGVDYLFFLGDAVGYMPGESDVLSRLNSLEASCQKGNHEQYLLRPTKRSIENEDVYRLQSSRLRLGQDKLKAIALWPNQRILDLAEKKALLIHGSPDNPLEGYIYPDSELSPYVLLPYDIFFMGNTHRPFIQKLDQKIFVNVGSVGLPRDYGSVASFAIYDSEQQWCRIVRVPFDTNRVLEKYGSDLHERVKVRLERSLSEPVEDIVGEI